MTAILSSICLLFSHTRALDIGWTARDYIFTVLAFALVAIAIGRNFLSFDLKIITVISVLFFAGLTGFYSLGMFAGGTFFFTLVAVILALFFSIKVVIIFGFLLIGLFILIAYGFISNTIELSNDPTLLHTNIRHWIVFIFAFVLSFMIVCSTIIRYRNVIRHLIHEVHLSHEKLSCSNEELKKAQNKIKKLTGILPLCSFCKKIRDEKGHWIDVDEYLDKNTEADISHGICPECLKTHYPKEYISINSFL